jgi:hypothetical protein
VQGKNEFDEKGSSTAPSIAHEWQSCHARLEPLAANLDLARRACCRRHTRQRDGSFQAR